jgi:hypothetical protein
MNQTLKITYPIQPQYADRLGGVLLTNQLSVGSVLTISGQQYTVKHSFLIKLRLSVTHNIMSVSLGDYKLYGTAKIKRFANILGIQNQGALIHCFFRFCQIQDSTAHVEYYFHSFTDENIFHTWTSV